MTDDPVRAEVERLGRQALHGADLKAWLFRCAICRGAVELIREELQVDETTALNLFAAWTHENSAVALSQAMDRLIAAQQKNISAMAPVIEQARREVNDDDPWRKPD